MSDVNWRFLVCLVCAVKTADSVINVVFSYLLLCCWSGLSRCFWMFVSSRYICVQRCNQLREKPVIKCQPALRGASSCCWEQQKSENPSSCSIFPTPNVLLVWRFDCRAARSPVEDTTVSLRFLSAVTPFCLQSKSTFSFLEKKPENKIRERQQGSNETLFDQHHFDLIQANQPHVGNTQLESHR